MDMHWCGSILCQVHSDVYAALNTTYTSLWTCIGVAAYCVKSIVMYMLH
jgi:hypothetical protein